MSQRHLCTHLHLLLLGLHIRIPHRRRLHLQLSLYPMSPFLLLLPLPRHMADVPIHLRGELHVSRGPPQPSQSLGTSTRGPSQFQVAKRSVVPLPITQKAKRLGLQILGTIKGRLKCVFIPLMTLSVFLLTVLFRQFPPGTVGFRLEPTVEEAKTERDKAERTGENEAAFVVQRDC